MKQHKLWSLLLTVVMVLTLVPATVFAAPVVSYDVFIGGQRITSETKDDVLDDGGTVSYDPDTRTLTLNNADLSDYYKQGDPENKGKIYSVDDITVLLKGDNTINSAYPNGNLTINAEEGATLRVKGVPEDRFGTAALQSNECVTINGGSYTIDSEEGPAINSVGRNDGTNGTITINNAVVTATGKNGGLIGHEVIVSNSNVNVTATYAAIQAMAGNITVKDSQIDAHSTDSVTFYSGSSLDWGYCKVANITVSNSTVNATSGKSNAFYTITDGTIKFDKSVVTASSAATDYPAVYSNGNVEANDSWMDFDKLYINGPGSTKTSNSVLFNGNEGTVYDSAVVSQNVQIPAGKTLTVPQGATLTISEGATLTNSGTLDLSQGTVSGTIKNDGSGKIECGENHKIELKNAKDATCAAEGYTGDKVCTVCGEAVEKGTAIEKLPHNFVDGKCTVCGATNSTFKPEIIAGANGVWQKGSKDGLSVTSSAAFVDFRKVQLDGKDLDVSNYTVKAGSTIVILKASYLETLSVGKYTLAIVSDTGAASTEFTIMAVAPSTNVPKTGDSSNPTLWMMLLCVSCCGMIVANVYTRKKKYGK